MRLPLVAVLLAHAAVAYELKTDHTGSDVRWTQPVRFTADARLEALLGAPGALDAVKAAAQAWTAAGVDVSVETGDVAGQDNVITAITSQWPYDDQVMAVTLLTLDATDHTILKANIFINAAQNQFRVLPADSQRGGGYADVQNTVTHELGHALGLAHVMDHPEAVMAPIAYDGDVNKRTLSADDVAGLDVLYPAGQSLDGAGPQVGCATTATTPWLALAMMMFVRQATRRATVARARARV